MNSAPVPHQKPPFALFPARVSMADIARASGVHHSTVSLALRNQSRIPAVTRERILKIAQSLGYVPDPLLDAFNFHRVTSQPGRRGPAIAFVSDQPTREAFHASAIHHAAYSGARDRADTLGYRVELFVLGPDRRTAKGLDRILRARGTTCVIAGILSSRGDKLELQWADYSAIAIESFQLNPALDSITSDLRASTRNQARRFQAAGHKRIGFVTTEEENMRLINLPLSGYLLECAREQFPPIPPLILPAVSPESQVRTWIRRHKPSAIIAGCTGTLALVCSGAWATSTGAVWAGPAPHSAKIELAEQIGNYRSMGARAVDFLALRQQVSQRGLPACRTTIVLPV